MGLFTSLFSSNGSEQSSGKDEIVFLRGTAAFGVDILGEDNYQAAFEALCGPRVPNGINRLVTASLILEDRNRHDKTAVRVEIRRKLVGYLSHDAAIRYRQQLQQRGTPKATGQCQAVIRGGWLSSDGRKGDYHVSLDIASLT